jgi:predicted secreted Zn-dependent protease
VCDTLTYFFVMTCQISDMLGATETLFYSRNQTVQLTSVSTCLQTVVRLISWVQRRVTNPDLALCYVREVYENKHK